MMTMTSGDGWRPRRRPSPILNDNEIANLARQARLSLNVDISRFGDSIRAAVLSYLEYAGRPSPREVRAEIAQLHKSAAATRHNDSDEMQRLQTMVDRLSQEAREQLHRPHQPFPALSTLADPSKRRLAARTLRGLTVTRLEWKTGRKRPRGKGSRVTLTKTFAGPQVPRGRPAQLAEFILCSGLAIAYSKATGRRPTRWPNDENRGPFIAMVSAVLKKIGAGHVSADDLARRYLSPTRKAKGRA
jgi:hypothetical protein